MSRILFLALILVSSPALTEEFVWTEVESKVSFSHLTKERLHSFLKIFADNMDLCLPKTIGVKLKVSDPEIMYFKDKYAPSNRAGFDFLRWRQRFHHWPYPLFKWFPAFASHRQEIQEKGGYQWLQDGYYQSKELRSESAGGPVPEPHWFFEIVQKRTRFNLMLKTPFSWGPNPDHLFIVSMDEIVQLNGFTPQSAHLYDELEIQVDRNSLFLAQELDKNPSLSEAERPMLESFKLCIMQDFRQLITFLRDEVRGEFLTSSKFTRISNALGENLSQKQTPKSDP